MRIRSGPSLFLAAAASLVFSASAQVTTYIESTITLEDCGCTEVSQLNSAQIN
jgi:hypothetical protein